MHTAVAQAGHQERQDGTQERTRVPVQNFILFAVFSFFFTFVNPGIFSPSWAKPWSADR